MIINVCARMRDVCIRTDPESNSCLKSQESRPSTVPMVSSFPHTDHQQPPCGTTEERPLVVFFFEEDARERRLAVGLSMFPRFPPRGRQSGKNARRAPTGDSKARRGAARGGCGRRGRPVGAEPTAVSASAGARAAEGAAGAVQRGAGPCRARKGRTHARTHARTDARTHGRTDARTDGRGERERQQGPQAQRGFREAGF